MPRLHLSGSLHLLFLLPLMTKSCECIPTTTANYETTQESQPSDRSDYSTTDHGKTPDLPAIGIDASSTTDRSDYSTIMQGDDNTGQPFVPHVDDGGGNTPQPDPPDPNAKGLDTTSSTTEALISTTTDEVERYGCPDDFLQLTIDWCFHFRYNIYEPMNFPESQSYCKEKNAILPAITSEDVTKALMLERTSILGISPFEMFYIGLGCDSSHRWQWIGGPQYDPQYAFFSREKTDSEYCFRHARPYQFDQFGTWCPQDPMSYYVSLVVCATRPQGYSPSSSVDAPCTDAWTQLPGGFCYHLTTISFPGLNIYDAEMNCRSVGGHLPAIRSSEQSNLIQAYLTGKGHQNSQFWLGLYCKFGDDYGPGSPGERAWIDGSSYGDFTNYLDENDDTDTCNVAFVDTFLYNGALKGKWQKENYSQLLELLMCTRPDPEPVPSSSTVTTRRTTPTTKIPEETTDDGETSDEPETTTPKKEEGKPRKLTVLELSLIIVLAVILITALIIIFLYFICKRCRKEQVQEMFNNVQKRFSRANTNVVTRTDEWEIRRQFVGIDYSRQLGRGAFGSVYLGRVFSGNIPEMAVKTSLQLNTLKKEDDFVAVKTLHETADRQAACEFLDEINIMKKIGFHERLVNLLACVTETEPLLLVVEYCSNGDLLKFMRERRMFMLKLKDTVGHEIAGRHSVITQKQQLMFGIQIAYGMEYLSQRGFVHRDLAARNILVDANETCKIGDFGLCRKIGGESEQYISRGGRLPWKWMAPEALERFYFSVESDVWSFGVLLFEIITLGGNPYPDWPAVELLHRLKAGERMPRPDGCSSEYYDIMLGCWRGVAMQRLSFEKIRRKLAHELEESSGDDYYLKLDAAAKYYQDAPESPRIERFNSF